MKTPSFLRCLVAVSLLGASLSMSRAAMVLIDFSTLTPSAANQIDSSTGYYWNSIAVVTSGSFSASLQTSANAASGFNLSGTTSASAGANNVGALASAPLPSWIGQNWISQDSLFIGSFNTLTMTLTGLTAGQNYNFIFFGARGNASSPVADNRTALYSVTSGTSAGSALLDAANNTTNTATINVLADSLGIATITMQASSASGNTGGFAYLNALQVTSVVPEPSSVAMCTLGGTLLMIVAFRRKNRTMA